MVLFRGLRRPCWIACLWAALLMHPVAAEPPSPTDAAARSRIEQLPLERRPAMYLAQAKAAQSRSLLTAETWARLALDAALAQGSRADELDARIMLANLALLATRADAAEPELALLEALVAQPDLHARVAEVLVLRGRWQILSRQFDAASASLEQAMQQARRLGDRTSEAKALHNQGLLAIRTGRQDEAQPLLEASLALNEADAREREADANRHYLGFIARDQGRYADALELHRVVLDHGRARGDSQVVAHSANALGILHAEKDQTAEALAYFTEAAEAHATLGDRYSEAMAHINIGNTLAADEQWAEALPALERGLAIAVAEDNADAEILARAERAKVLIRLDRADEAQADARRAVELVDAGATSARQHQATQALGLVLARRGEHAAAKPMFQRSVKASRDSGRKTELRDGLYELARSQAALGEHADANQNLEAAIKLDAELRDDEMTRRLAELRVQLETRQREAELAVRQQRIDMLEQQAEQQSRIRLLMIAALLSSTMLILALVSRFRTKQRAERELRLQHALIARANADLAEAADTDVLTRTRNRRYFQRVVQPCLQAAQRDGRPYALVLIDADHFKHINDTFGHDVGDVALVAIVQAWRGLPGPDDALVRWGGEEFLAVWFDGVPAIVQQRVEGGLAATREQAIFAGDIPVPLTVSVGWACGPWPDADHYQLLALADRALLHAKSQGRDRGYGLHPGLSAVRGLSPMAITDLNAVELDAAH